MPATGVVVVPDDDDNVYIRIPELTRNRLEELKNGVPNYSTCIKSAVGRQFLEWVSGSRVPRLFNSSRGYVIKHSISRREPSSPYRFIIMTTTAVSITRIFVLLLHPKTLDSNRIAVNSNITVWFKAWENVMRKALHRARATNANYSWRLKRRLLKLIRVDTLALRFRVDKPCGSA